MYFYSYKNIQQMSNLYKKCFFLQVAALITLPFDVIKTHQQIELGEKEIYTG